MKHFTQYILHSILISSRIGSIHTIVETMTEIVLNHSSRLKISIRNVLRHNQVTFDLYLDQIRSFIFLVYSFMDA